MTEDFAVELSTAEKKQVKDKMVETLAQGSDGEMYAGKYPRWLMNKDDGVIYHGLSKYKNKRVGIPKDELNTHQWVSGVTSSGKSTVLLNQMVQYAQQGHGLCFIDPKGGDVKELVQMLPKDRLNDIVWIDPELNEGQENMVGFNLFEVPVGPNDPSFPAERDRISEEAREFFRDPNQSQTYENVMGTIGKAFAESQKNYGFGDLYFLLSNKEYQEDFFEEMKDEDMWDLQGYMKKIVEDIEEDDLEWVIKRLKETWETSTIRSFIGFNSSSITLEEAMEEDKIILVKNDNDEIQEKVARYFLKKFWHAAQKRWVNKGEKYVKQNPYFLIVDEASSVIQGDVADKINTILEKARAAHLSLTLAMQQPKQIPKAVRENLVGNVGSRVLLQHGSKSHARITTDGVYSNDGSELEPSKVEKLPKFESITSTPMSYGSAKNKQRAKDSALAGTESKATTIETNNFAPFPIRRDEEAAERIIRKSQKQYGSEPPTEAEDFLHEDTLKLLNRVNDDESSEDEIEEAVVKAIGSAQYYENRNRDDIYEKEAFELHSAPKSTVSQTLKSIRNDFTQEDIDLSSTIVQDVVEDSSSINTTYKNDEMHYEITRDGQDVYNSQSSGSSGSGGGDKHRWLLKRMREVFPVHGIAATVPKQGGDEEKADGHGYIFEREETPLNDKHERFIPVEAETSTHRKKPYQTWQNFDKAYRDGDSPVVFAVLAKNDDFAKEARQVDRLLQQKSNKKAGDWVAYYINSDTDISFDSGKPVRPINSNKTTKWWFNDETDEIVLVERGDITTSSAELDTFDPHAKFENPYDYMNRSPSDFPAMMSVENGELVVRVDGEVVDRYDDESRFKSDWTTISRPYIPDIEVEQKPNQDDYIVIILPDKTGRKPTIYSNGTLYDLSGNKIQPNTDSGKQNEPSEDELENISDNPQVATEKKPNTNEVVKNSEKEWTKPEKGDDDYNPAKDNSNYTTGYDEEHTDSNWTGGGARKEDENGDFKDYEPPETDTTEEEDEDDEEDPFLSELKK